VLRLRHTYRLARDAMGLVVADRIWWLLPMVVAILVLAFAVTAANAALPYAVYTLF
jgi:hypothetical protein